MNQGNFGDPFTDHASDGSVGFTLGAALGAAASFATGRDDAAPLATVAGGLVGFALGSALGTTGGTHDAWLAKGGLDGYVQAARKQRRLEGHRPCLGEWLME